MLLLFIPMHPEKPFFFQSLRVHFNWHSTVLLWITASTATAVLPTLHLHPKCISLPCFSLPPALYLMLFKFSTSSFPPLQPVCVGGEMGWVLGLWPFPRVLYRVLSDYFILQSCHRPLSETGVNPGSGEAWKGVGGKYQGSGFAMKFISSPRVGAQKQGHGLCWGDIWVCNTHVGQGITAGKDRASRLQPQVGGSPPEKTRDVCQGGNSVSKWLWAGAWMCQQGRWKTSANVDREHHFISREKWGT